MRRQIASRSPSRCPQSRRIDRLPVSPIRKSMKTDMSDKLKVMAYALIVALMLSIAQEVSAGEIEWLTEMSPRLKSRMPDEKSRIALLKTVLYESNRAGLNPQLVLSIIDVASGFRKYAVSPKGAQGYMQVAPSWLKTIGEPDANLFHLRTNIRYGCTLLRYFVDFEKGDLMRALVRYRSQMSGLVEVEGEPVASSFDFPRTVERMSKTRWLYDGPRG
jgi:soluble lytic murein transglycosylase-like protein